jgi:type VI secretion system protein ImpM
LLRLFGHREVEPPGFYGKVPVLGDFLSRRMPPGFVQTWDEWLQRIVENSRAAIGESWLDAWLEAPIWHFALGKGVAGPAPCFGVLIPSVDRVGRYFPFTILGLGKPGGMALDDWGRRVEALALAALDDGFDPARLEADLAALGSPAEIGAPPKGETRWVSNGGLALNAAGRLPETMAVSLVTGRP